MDDGCWPACCPRWSCTWTVHHVPIVVAIPQFGVQLERPPLEHHTRALLLMALPQVQCSVVRMGGIPSTVLPSSTKCGGFPAAWDVKKGVRTSALAGRSLLNIFGIIEFSGPGRTSQEGCPLSCLATLGALAWCLVANSQAKAGNFEGRGAWPPKHEGRLQGSSQKN